MLTKELRSALTSSGFHAVVSMSLSAAGSPLAVLSNSSAYVYQPGMKTWMRMVDSAFALSSYSSILASSVAGDLSAMRFCGSMTSMLSKACLLMA